MYIPEDEARRNTLRTGPSGGNKTTGCLTMIFDGDCPFYDFLIRRAFCFALTMIFDGTCLTFFMIF
jgi:hypothetical protein